MLSAIFNSQFNTIDVIFGIANLIGICYALYWNIKASLNSPDILFNTRVRITALATIYFVSYLILLFTSIDIPTWSSIMRAFGPLVWVIVWGNTAKASLNAQKKLPDILVDEVIKKLNGKDGNEQ